MQVCPLWPRSSRQGRRATFTIINGGRSPQRESTLKMAKNKNKDTQVVYRDSKTGEFLTQRQAERKDPATWEREHIHHPKK